MIAKGSTLDDDMGILPNVNIEVVGENRSAISDANGQFTVTVNSPESVLHFSHASYYYEEMPASEFRKLGYVQLGQSANNLDEVAVYNTTKKDSSMLWVLGIIGALVAVKMVFKSSK